MARTCPFVSPTSSIKLDKRTREYRMLKQVRGELTAHVGGFPSAVQRRLIERTAILHVRLAMLDAKMLLTRDMTEGEMKTYVYWQNSYTKLLTALGVKARGKNADRPTIADIVRRAA